jgi:hypothetical protein
MMKCTQCKSDMVNGNTMIITPPDGDSFCNETCYSKYKAERDEFFDNIGNDKLYENYMKIN